MKQRVILEWTLRIGLAAVFIYAGAKKLPDTEAFFWDIHHFELTHPDVSILLALFLPWLEIFVGIALLSGRLYFGGIAICTGLSAVFLAAIGSAWYRGLDVTCGCFGRTDNATDFPKHIAIDTALLLASLALCWLAWGRVREASAETANSAQG